MSTMYGDGSDKEKAPSDPPYVVPSDNRYHFDQSDLDRVQRRLKQRHVQMSVFLLIHRASPYSALS
jgi:hypothetical protein